MSELTGERLLPDAQRQELVYAEHLVRYRFAAQLCDGHDVLDAACGEGYGTALLARTARSVVGVDIDETAVAAATARYELDFRTADIASMPFDDESFDVVVSFETIEHVPDPEAALAEYARVLRSDGVLVISTPNADEYLDDNEFHTREFTPREFTDLLGTRFGPVRFLHQQNWLTSAVLEAGELEADDPCENLDVELSKAAGTVPGRELYLVAVCGEPPVSLRRFAVATQIYEAHRLAQLPREWMERAAEAERLVEAWLERAREAERQVKEARETIKRMERSVSWRITRPLRAAKAGAARARGGRR
jgi:SAM-dependent methyltransferase